MTTRELIGLLPAAGRGTRLGPIPTSKEIMPLGFESIPEKMDAWRPFTTMESHLRAFAQAGIRRVAIVLGRGKFDIIDYLGSGERFGLEIAYLYQEQLRGMPFALDIAHPWVGAADTVFTMPDTLVQPEDTVTRLNTHHRSSGADLTLGLFATDNPAKFGMVKIDGDGAKARIVQFIDKPKQTTLKLMWGLAVWTPVFGAFMHKHLSTLSADRPEYVLSDVFQAAVDAGMKVAHLDLVGSRYNDIGTPEEFQQVVRALDARRPHG